MSLLVKSIKYLGVYAINYFSNHPRYRERCEKVSHFFPKNCTYEKVDLLKSMLCKIEYSVKIGGKEICVSKELVPDDYYSSDVDSDYIMKPGPANGRKIQLPIHDKIMSPVGLRALKFMELHWNEFQKTFERWWYRFFILKIRGKDVYRVHLDTTRVDEDDLIDVMISYGVIGQKCILEIQHFMGLICSSDDDDYVKELYFSDDSDNDSSDGDMGLG